ncbi:MAG: choline/ethanolamine kinase family protein [Steroidobacteraceae bacterium]
MAQLAAQPAGRVVKQGSPAAVEATIAAVIAELGMDRPHITELSGGVANRSLRLCDARHDYVLRLAGEAAPGLGASRDSELAMQGIAAAAGLAPEIRLANPPRGFIVLRYVHGRVPDLSGMRDLSFLERVGAWIARLHGLASPPGLPVVDIGERAAGYLAVIQRREPRPLVADIARELAARRAALQAPPRRTACHHDLHHRNFLDTGDSLLVVDWEYAGPGDPAADLASCIGYHDLDSTQVGALLAGYGADSVELRERLASLGWIFDCLWFGWNAVAMLAGLEYDPELQERLAARLTG